MLHLSDKWAPRLVSQPETGMGYWIARIILRDGRVFENVAITAGIISRVNGRADIPFVEEDIADIVGTGRT